MNTMTGERFLQSVPASSIRAGCFKHMHLSVRILSNQPSAQFSSEEGMQRM